MVGKRVHETKEHLHKNTQTLPVDAAQRVQVFRDGIMQTIDQFGILMQMFFNMDQTFALFELRLMYTANAKGAKSIDVRTSRSNMKLGCTVTLTGTATGGKLPAHITFPRKGFVCALAAQKEEAFRDNV